MQKTHNTQKNSNDNKSKNKKYKATETSSFLLPPSIYYICEREDHKSMGTCSVHVNRWENKHIHSFNIIQMLILIVTSFIKDSCDKRPQKE